MKYIWLLIIASYSLAASVGEEIIAIRGLDIQADGRIVLAGYRSLNNIDQFATIRLLANGQLDPSYGVNGNGQIYETTVANSNCQAFDIDIQADGKAVVAGTFTGATKGLSIARYTTAGVLDSTFGTGGIVSTTISSDASTLAVLVDPSQRILISGSRNMVPFYGTANVIVGYIARLDSNGNFDIGFNNALGIYDDLSQKQLQALALDSSNNIYAAGYSYSSTGQQQAHILELNPNGTSVFLNFDLAIGTISTLNDILIQPDNKIVVAGKSDNNLLLMRLSGGALDGTFGTGGIVSIPIGIDSSANGIKLQADGKFIVSGYSDGNLLVARFTSAGVLDTTYNSIGYRLVPLGNSSQSNDVALDASGFAVAVGQFDNSAIATRINTSGIVDTTFDQNGIMSHPAGSTTPTLFGNCVRVDKIYGNDAMGSRNGAPFLTINAALAACFSGDTCWIFPGTYNESFTIPQGVSVKGFADRSVTIQQTGVTSATDLVTMSNNSRLENVSLNLTSSAHVQLRAVVFGGTTTLNASVENSFITVNNSTAGAGTSNVYGIHSSGTGMPSNGVINVRDCRISVSSINNGDKRAIYLGTANELNIRDSELVVAGSGGTGSYVAVETENASAVCALTGCVIQSSGSGLAQTLGQLFCTACNVVNVSTNANSSLKTRIASPAMYFAPYVALSGTQFFTQGNSILNGTNLWGVRINQPMLAKSLSCRSATAGGGSQFIVRKNSSNTALSIVLPVGVTTMVLDNVAVTFGAGDILGLLFIASTTPTLPVINLELY